MAAIATVTGTAILPGISRNNRKYTAEAIAKMVERAQNRIDDPDGMPITMLTHHAAEDDSTRLVGQLTRIWQEADGVARFEAAIDDTENGRDIAKLATPAEPGRKPTLKGVSIRGAWVGPVRREVHDGQAVETAPDVELDGLDFTRKPGVVGAGVDSVEPLAPPEPRESDGTARMLITESAPEATLTITEADTPAVSKRGSGLTGDGVSYADPGYQADKKQRYDISSKQKAKTAWAYISRADDARAYTSAQLKRIKQRIIKALKSFGVTVDTKEGWLIEPATAVTEALAECWGMDAADAGNLYVSLTNGPTTVTVSSCSLDPHDLDAVGRAAMAGAARTLLNIDPDLDADVDVPGSTDDDGAVATAAGTPCPCGCGCAIPETPGGCPCECESCMHCKGETSEDDDAMETAPETPAPETPTAETTTQEKEPAMAESAPTPAAETPGTDSGVDALNAKFDKLTDLIGGLVTAMAPKPAQESAPAEPMAEAQPAAAEVTETEDQRIARLVAEGVKAALPGAIQEHVQTTGGPSRKGLVAQVAENAAESSTGTAGLPEGWPQKPLHQYSQEEWRAYAAPAAVGAVLGSRGAVPAE